MPAAGKAEAVRAAIGVVAAAAAAALLAGCGGDDNARRQAWIKATTEGCERGFASRQREQPDALPPGIDGSRLCACAVARVAEGKSGAELEALSRDKGPGPRQLEAIGACAVEEARRSGALK